VRDQSHAGLSIPILRASGNPETRQVGLLLLTSPGFDADLIVHADVAALPRWLMWSPMAPLVRACRERRMS
jgi:hypothetical protein